MIHFSRYIITAIMAVVFCGVGMAQDNKNWREMHKVKSKETLYGIAREYGLTVQDLVKANPEMSSPDYKLKKGDYIFIPYPEGTAASKATNVTKAEVPAGALRVGVVLPLHNVDGDGRRMLEYYRGLLMACEDLKRRYVNRRERMERAYRRRHIPHSRKRRHGKVRCHIRAAVLQTG